jgi:hypothetical protein
MPDLVFSRRIIESLNSEHTTKLLNERIVANVHKLDQGEVSFTVVVILY